MYTHKTFFVRDSSLHFATYLISKRFEESAFNCAKIIKKKKKHFSVTTSDYKIFYCILENKI